MGNLRFRPSKDFNIELKRLSKMDRSIVSEVKEAIETLLEMNSLPKEFKDHQLKNELSDYREFHIRDTPQNKHPNQINDVIITYSINYGDLVLTAIHIGTHQNILHKK
ncbi:type II toxin-antitoxin system mRNA interferase toxin, RelE/StbE family [Apilactobacillus timberlakei]|uniref:type II toxin-antitoxin system RelE/ParE family toxin n=1 Tax=Apilactobacillus timberlakei TaxID=2008380 RepID=UPI00112C0F1F|nr:type II toxin-antitoxin system mRNA interferase toxin, RelE/StbE family [Apilactobacillus timberlakei]TPR18022.1 type II toxin-antitoxin system mRNA interferase toxin, RelE/StbE family [Apilactobacillus timberlakei]TPR19824.1 type II toxin-antitoxin system mRNA interferase toxin, RelE/StbE family [Apilactobacillus timberlakei]TPR21362.1 type II toxin-antitoxin system mRNA interferase toxin, RelE/StbE family [Apilactobacillus timberlakei]